MNDCRTPALVAFLVAVSTAGSGLLPAAAEQGAAAFELRPGVIVDPGRGLAYVMNPAGGIDAVALRRGQVTWTTREGAKPLALVGNRLAAQTEPTSPGELEVVVLDVNRRGQAVVAGDWDLQPGVRSAIDETAESAFTAAAQPVAGDVVISWSYQERGKRGMVEIDPLAQEGEGQESLEALAAAADSSGTLRMDLDSGEIVPAPAGVAAAAAAVPGGPQLSPEEALPGVAGTQFLSADGRHVLASELVGDERVTEPYLWTIYERSSGERLGTIRSPTSWAPFFVSGSLLIHESPTFFETSDGEISESPLRLRAVDLGTGREVWTRRVRDTVYRGPLPP